MSAPTAKLTPEQIEESARATAWLQAPYNGEPPLRAKRALPYLITGYLRENSPRFEDFARVFGGNVIPLQSIETRLANLPGIGEALVFMLDLGQLTIDQHERLCDFLTERFGTPRGQVPDILAEEGMPVLASDIVVYVGRGEAL